MQEGKRQKQVAGVLQEELNTIFRKLNLHMMGGGMVSIANVKVTPDLLEARVYISVFNVEQPELALKRIEDRAWEIKKELSEKVKHQLRRIPVFHYFYDDTLDYVFKMEAVFEKLKSEQPPTTETENS
ncbi:MAG: ribosome-binding factor A [Bacteroidetes bacterium]|jgi:ribosome-binding factor A|nr:MAG: ribosome-binding factor A [Bacteroidota bacterium]TAE71668.1 MAG: ribosome-binding factor A [Bacteroidota bacterium]TAF96758.1 MAG: ribosome-binding factor A [Bacteroidota bacterium]